MNEDRRKYLYWCIKNGKKDQLWFVAARLGEMLEHEKTVTDPNNNKTNNCPLKHENMTYVYNCCISEDHFTIFVEDQQYYYIIDNQRVVTKQDDGEPQVSISSNVWYHTCPIKLISKIPNGLRKRLQLKLHSRDKPLNFKFKTAQLEALKGVLPQDFSRASHQEQVELWIKYTEQLKNNNVEVLDLSGFFFFKPRVIIEANKKYNFTTVLLNQNVNINSLNWLFYFPQVNIVSLWYLNSLEDDHLKGINNYCPLVTTLEFHQCPNISGRSLLHLFKMKVLENLIIDNDKAIFHDHNNLKETVITDKEWSSVDLNKSIKHLLINSTNLTRDFIKPLLSKVYYLEHFIMNDTILVQLQKNSSSGHSDRVVKFHSEQNLQQGFKRNQDVRVYDLVKDKFGPMFSESMLNKIKALDPNKKDVVDILMKND